MSINTKSTGSLLIITDDNETDNFDYCTRLLNIFYKKLTDLNINLNKTYLINRNEFENIIQQFKQIEKSSQNDWILITTTNVKNDCLMQEIANGLNGGKYDIDKRIFFLNQSNFYCSLAICLNQISRTQCLKLSFCSDCELKCFLTKLLPKTAVNYSLDTVYLIKNNDIKIRNLFSNYSYCSIEIEFINKQLTETFQRDCFKDNYPLADNYINADYYVYDFDNFVKNSTNNQKDIEFLLGKIDYTSFVNKLKSSIEIIEEAFKRYKSDQICVSFNGGKDCCVVLYLFYAVASRLGIKFPLNVLFIHIQNEFDEMEFFVENVHKYYYRNSFQFIVFSDVSKTMKDCLSEMKISNPSINSILLGTRRSDGAYFKQMQAFAPTDGNWPEFMRINPILDWTFSEIWYFIRKLQLPYCSLYDHGYTSIDSTQNTVQNKGLLMSDGVNYLPAYMLENQEAERDSRKKP